MTTPKREEPPFVSNDWIVDKAREIATDICGPEPVPTPDDFEDDPKSEWHATFDGACKLGFEVQKEHEELVSRLRTEQEGKDNKLREALDLLIATEQSGGELWWKAIDQLKALRPSI